MILCFVFVGLCVCVCVCVVCVCACFAFVCVVGLRGLLWLVAEAVACGCGLWLVAFGLRLLACGL